MAAKHSAVSSVMTGPPIYVTEPVVGKSVKKKTPYVRTIDVEDGVVKRERLYGNPSVE